MCLALKLLNPIHFASDKALVGVHKSRTLNGQVKRNAILPSPTSVHAVSVVCLVGEKTCIGCFKTIN